MTRWITSSDVNGVTLLLPGWIKVFPAPLIPEIWGLQLARKLSDISVTDRGRNSDSVCGSPKAAIDLINITPVSDRYG